MLIDFLKKKFSTAINYTDNKAELKSVTVDEVQNAIYEFIEHFVQHSDSNYEWCLDVMARYIHSGLESQRSK